MRVHGPFARRPGEDREASVLRRDERDRVALIVNELRGRQMARTAKRRWMDLHRHTAFDWFGHRHDFDWRSTTPANNLRPERQELVLGREDRRAIDGGEPCRR